jgi:integrase
MWDHLEEFVEWTRTRVEPPPVKQRTAKQYRRRLTQFRDWHEGREGRGAPLTPPALIAWCEHLQFDRRGRHGGSGQKPRTIKGQFTALSQFLRWLEEERGIQGLPDPRKTKRPRINRHDHGGFRPPTEEEAKTIFERAEAWPGYTLNERFLRARGLVSVSLGIDGALRRCEVLGLDVEDVLQGETWRVNIRYGKNTEHRTVEANGRLRKYLAAYLDLRKEWCDVAPARRRNRALLAVDARRRVDEDTLHALRHRLLFEAGLKGAPIRFQDLRVYRITGWLSVAGVNVEDVRELAGHADAATTLGYARSSEARKHKAVLESEGGDLHGNGNGDSGRPREKRKPKRQRPGGPRARWA